MCNFKRGDPVSERDYDLLRSFLEDRDVSRRAAAPLKDGTQIAITIKDDPGLYHVIREKGSTYVRRGPAPGKTQLSFTISSAAIERLNEFQSDSIGEFGIEFFRIMMSGKENEVLDVKLHVGLIGLTRMGAFKILMAGGPSVMGFLARKGFGSIKDIHRAVKKASGD
jgi:hypothetical protein